jgi:hypothetical protein
MSLVIAKRKETWKQMDLRKRKQNWKDSMKQMAIKTLNYCSTERD